MSDIQNFPTSFYVRASPVNYFRMRGKSGSYYSGFEPAGDMGGILNIGPRKFPSTGEKQIFQ